LFSLFLCGKLNLMRKLFNDRGVVHILPLLLIIAAVGIISFLLISSTAPTGGLLGELNPKPRSNAATPMPSGMMGGNLMNNDCNLLGQAFCDTFDTPFPVVSRTGQINPNTWSVAHVNTTVNLGQGSANTWAATHAMHCKDSLNGVLPPNDYFMCGIEVPESEHFMEALDDDSNYIFNSERILQPFDFTNRTGTIVFDVDAKNTGSHGWWIEMWITPDPVPGPHIDSGHIENISNGIGLFFQDDCIGNGGSINPGETGSGATGSGRIEIARNGVIDSPPVVSQIPAGVNHCFKTEPDMKNHIMVKINQQHIEIWASDYDGSNFREVTFADNLGLTFSRGFIHFQDSHYDAFKAENANGLISGSVTYHWDNIGFDGPVLPTPRKYSVPDDNLKPDATHVNLGYYVDQSGNIASLPINGVNLTGATGATLSFNTYADGKLNYRFNGGNWHSLTNAFNWSAFGVPVSLSELRTGNNTVEFQSTDGGTHMVANIDLLIDNGGPAFTPFPTPVPTPTPIPTATPIPTPTPAGQSLPPTPTVSVPACITPGYAGSGVTVSWGSVSPAVTFADISTDSGFSSFWNKAVPSGTSLTGPSGFTGFQGVTGGLTLNPNTQYFVRLYNGFSGDGHGSVASFSVPACTSTTSTPAPTQAPTATPTCSKASLGDINCDGSINIFDYNIMIGNFGKSGTGLQGDLNGDNTVNIFDYNILVGNFGK
jgi:hypothetical protein